MERPYFAYVSCFSSSVQLCTLIASFTCNVALCHRQRYVCRAWHQHCHNQIFKCLPDLATSLSQTHNILTALVLQQNAPWLPSQYTVVIQFNVMGVIFQCSWRQYVFIEDTRAEGDHCFDTPEWLPELEQNRANHHRSVALLLSGANRCDNAIKSGMMSIQTILVSLKHFLFKMVVYKVIGRACLQPWSPVRLLASKHVC